MHQLAGVMAVAAEGERRIAVAVEHDVMLIRHHGREIELLLGVQDDARAFRGVPVHEGPLLFGELARLGQDLDRNAHLADVVQQPRDTEAAYVARAESQVLGERRSEEHTSELQSRSDLVCRLLLEKKKGSTNPSQTSL